MSASKGNVTLVELDENDEPIKNDIEASALVVFSQQKTVPTITISDSEEEGDDVYEEGVHMSQDVRVEEVEHVEDGGAADVIGNEDVVQNSHNLEVYDTGPVRIIEDEYYKDFVEHQVVQDNVVEDFAKKVVDSGVDDTVEDDDSDEVDWRKKMMMMSLMVQSLGHLFVTLTKMSLQKHLI